MGRLQNCYTERRQQRKEHQESQVTRPLYMSHASVYKDLESLDGTKDLGCKVSLNKERSTPPKRRAEGAGADGAHGLF